MHTKKWRWVRHGGSPDGAGGAHGRVGGGAQPRGDAVPRRWVWKHGMGQGSPCRRPPCILFLAARSPAAHWRRRLGLAQLQSGPWAASRCPFRWAVVLVALLAFTSALTIAAAALFGSNHGSCQRGVALARPGNASERHASLSLHGCQLAQLVGAQWEAVGGNGGGLDGAVVNSPVVQGGQYWLALLLKFLVPRVVVMDLFFGVGFGGWFGLVCVACADTVLEKERKKRTC